MALQVVRRALGGGRGGTDGTRGTCPPEPPVPMAGLKQELFHRHKEAQQCCRPHNLPLLRAAQQREMEVRGAGLEMERGREGCCRAVSLPRALTAPLLQEHCSISRGFGNSCLAASEDTSCPGWP